LTGFRSIFSLLLLVPLVLTIQGAAQRQDDLAKPGGPSQTGQISAPHGPVFGFRDFTAQAKLDATFMAVPDPRLAEQHLKVLTVAPHWASSPEDYATALYVAGRFKSAGLQTEIIPYRVLLNKPTSIIIEAFDKNGVKILAGPSREHVDAVRDIAPNGGPGNATNRFQDKFQDDPGIAPAFNGSSPSGDVTAEVVYANYGRQSDFERLAQMGVSLKGRIALVRYGADFRGVKVYLAQQYGAAGVLIYSDPTDNGFRSGDPYPAGPYRPDSAVQRGSVQFLPIYPGDPTTPGVASVPSLPGSERIAVDKLQNSQPSIPVHPLSSADAAPILQALTGPEAPHDWQGGLPFTYHLGGGTTGGAKPGGARPGTVTVHMHLEQDARLRTIWDVIGRIPGTDDASQWVIAGNHRDAWVYGAADPGSGTAAMLEAVHGLGTLLKQGWHPRRTIVMASWDAEEEGLMGSTEWAEQHAAELSHAVAYLNTDVAVSGPSFNAAAVPSLRQFLREITREVPSPTGGTVYDEWRRDEHAGTRHHTFARAPHFDPDVDIGDLGSGSDYTPFLQHLGIPSTDIGSDGPYGVYHTIYDNYQWFTRFADPNFLYTQQQARVFGLEILHMADADFLPLDYVIYAEEIVGYLDAARSRAIAAGLTLDFSAANAATGRFANAALAVRALQSHPPPNLTDLNQGLRGAERAFLLPSGLPRRPWYKHSIYAPGEFTGYTAVVIPGVNEAIDAADAPRVQAQLALLAQALNRSASSLEAALK
jgi:N-acetylated-alpha-linked acidic dipeptidase